MAHLFSLLALLWLRPVAILEVLRDDDVPVPVSVTYGLTCGLIGAVFPWFTGAWSTPFAALMVLCAALAPLVFGALLWGASALFGSETSTWPQAVALAAALLGVFPLASLVQFIGANAATGIFGGVVLPLFYFVVLTGMGFVITLQANPLAGAGFGTLGVLAVFGWGIFSWKQQHPIVPPAAEGVSVAPARPSAAEPNSATPPAAPVPAAPPPPAPVETERWEVKLKSDPPGAEVTEVATGRVLGSTPLTLEFPFSQGKVQVRLKLGKSEALYTLDRDLLSIVSVKLPR